VAVKELAGTFSISFEYSTTSDPDGNYPIFQGTERWSVAGSVRLVQQSDMPNAWEGDGDAAMQVDLDTLTSAGAGVVYRDSVRAAGRVRLSTPDFPAKLAVVSDARYWISFGLPELVAREDWVRIDTGERRTATPRVTVYAQVQDAELPRQGQRLRGRQEISLSDGSRIGMVPFDWIGWTTLWPRDPARAPKALVTWDLAPVVHEYRLEVEISGYADWFPQAGRDERTPGADLAARARLVERDGSPADPAVVKKYLFELEDVSREPGVAMNWPPPARATRDPDLRFDRDRNFDLPNWVVDDRRVEVTDDAAPQVVLTSYDWGAHGFLRVSAELHDGRIVYGALRQEPGRLRIAVPKRRDGSRIAERYRSRVGDRADHADDEDRPRGDGTRGDGLTVYQEYRGFHVNGAHVRGDLERKDLFVALGPGLAGFAEPGIRGFARATGLSVHDRLAEDELTDDEVINPNQVAAASHRQRGIRVLREDIEPAGRAHPRDPGATVIRSPGELDHISIDTGLAPQGVRRNGRLQVSPNYSRVVAHELGHGVGIRHHGEGDRKQVSWVAGANGALSEDGSAIKLRNESGGSMSFRSLAPGASVTVWLGEHGGEHSGDERCFMRYVVSNAYRSTAQGDVRYWVNPPEPLGGPNLCSARDGTGVNQAGRAPQPRYGNASAGNCLGQIRVRDR
jgi:hypothetical protein